MVSLRNVIPICIQEHGFSSWEHHLLITLSLCVINSLKTLHSHSYSPYVHLKLLCLCSNRICALVENLHSDFFSALGSFLNSPNSRKPAGLLAHGLTYEMIYVGIQDVSFTSLSIPVTLCLCLLLAILLICYQKNERSSYSASFRHSRKLPKANF